MSDCHAVRSAAVWPARTASHWANVPKLDPCSVTDREPVVTLLDRLVLLSAPMFAEMPIVAVPTRPPSVSTARTHPRMLCAMQLSPVSDAQRVCSHSDRPIRADTVDAESPILDPYSITTDAPVAAALDPSTALICGLSAETAPVPDPRTSPVVSDNRRLPQAPYPAPHRNEVSDSHDERSQAVLPSLDVPVESAPMLDPTIVRLADPVSARFTARPALKADLAKEIAPVSLPVRRPAVNDIRPLPLPVIPGACNNVNDVSDSHTDPSHAVDPCDAVADSDHDPIPAPCIVTRADPVVALLLWRDMLSLPSSTEYTALVLPTRCPVDIVMRAVLATHAPAMHRIAVSDAQPAVPSQADHPVLADSLSPDSPSIAPCTVKLDAPVKPALIRRGKLNERPSAEKSLELLPAARPDVTSARRLCIDPAEPRHCVDESDTHRVASHPV